MWEYFYGAMTVSTGYVKVFTMFELRGGFVLQLPAGADFDHAAPYIYRPKHLEVFSQSADWCEILGVTNVSDLSRMIEEKKLRNCTSKRQNRPCRWNSSVKQNCR
jgi:uridine kinase